MDLKLFVLWVWHVYLLISTCDVSLFCSQNGFDQLQSLVINPNAYPSGKVSKAAILEKSEGKPLKMCTHKMGVVVCMSL